MQFKKFVVLAALTTLVSMQPVCSQGGNPTISAVTLQVVPNQQGSESVVTPRGMVVPLPGPGVGTNSVQIFMGSQGGYWYVDRNGQNVDLTSAVERFRQMSGQMGNMAPQAQVPQYAAAPPVNVYNEQAPSSSSSNSGSGAGSALVTATAAGLGAMAGTAMTGAYYNNGYYNGVPYGTPIYYPHGGNPYYRGAGGNTVNVNGSYTGASGNTVNTGTQVNNAHANAFAKQQDWYANQQRQNPQQFQNWQQSAQHENPFVARGAQQDGAAQNRFGAGRNAEAGAQGEGGRRGLFNRGGNDGDGGGRFNRGGEAQEAQGGRFNRGGDAQAGQAGGRFNREQNAGGGRFGGGANNAGGGRFGGRRNR